MGVGIYWYVWLIEKYVVMFDCWSMFVMMLKIVDDVVMVVVMMMVMNMGVKVCIIWFCIFLSDLDGNVVGMFEIEIKIFVFGEKVELGGEIVVKVLFCWDMEILCFY